MLDVLTFAFATTLAPAQSAPVPFACRANALDKAQRQRQQALLETVRNATLATRDLPDGFSLSFPPDAALFLQLAEWISLERRCCPFLEFGLEWKLDDSVSVRLTGQPGVKEVIAAEMGIAPGR
jgi:hypothetical protein